MARAAPKRRASPTACAVELGGRVFEGGGTHPPGRVTLSAGVATFPLDAGDDATLLRAADAKLYLAKQAGRNCVMPEPRL